MNANNFSRTESTSMSLSGSQKNWLAAPCSMSLCSSVKGLKRPRTSITFFLRLQVSEYMMVGFEVHDSDQACTHGEGGLPFLRHWAAAGEPGAESRAGNTLHVTGDAWPVKNSQCLLRDEHLACTHRRGLVGLDS